MDRPDSDRLCDLLKAQTRLERVSELTATGDQPFYETRALAGLGQIKQQRGDLAAALKSYSDSLAISERLAESDPGNAGRQRDVSVSFAKFADAHKQLGDKEKARDYLRQGQAIMARLTKLSPKNAAWKQDLAWFDGEIAELTK